MKENDKYGLVENKYLILSIEEVFPGVIFFKTFSFIDGIYYNFYPSGGHMQGSKISRHFWYIDTQDSHLKISGLSVLFFFLLYCI